MDATSLTHRSARRRLLALLVLVLTVAGIVTAATVHRHLRRSPLFVDAPVGAPRNCALPATEATVRGSVWVDADPAGVVLVWYPGMNAKPCHSELDDRSDDSALARRLADDIRSAPSGPSGTYNCPNDDGGGVTLYFRYPAHTRAETVDVMLGGCGGIVARGRGPVLDVGHLAVDLAAVAPPGYASRLAAATRNPDHPNGLPLHPHG